MFIVIYNKQTKYIAQLRHDNSVGVEKPTPEFWLQEHCESQNLNSNNFAVASISFDKKLQIVLGRDLFDETNNTIYADPDWVAPTPAPTPTE